MSKGEPSEVHMGWSSQDILNWVTKPVLGFSWQLVFTYPLFHKLIAKVRVLAILLGLRHAGWALPRVMGYKLIRLGLLGKLMHSSFNSFNYRLDSI